MSDFPIVGEQVGDDVANLLALLLGGQLTGDYPDAALRRLMFGGPGLLRRMIQSNQGDPAGRMQTLSSQAAVNTLTVPDGAQSCTFSVEVANIRMTVDGTTPTSSVGLLLSQGGIYTLTGRATLQAVQFIQTAVGAVIQATYFT